MRKEGEKREVCERERETETERVSECAERAKRGR